MVSCVEEVKGRPERGMFATTTLKVFVPLVALCLNYCKPFPILLTYIPYM